MKKLLITLALALSLGACGVEPPSADRGKTTRSEPYGFVVQSAISPRNWSMIGVWTDPKTGCEYFTGEVSGGIMMTGRNSKGGPVCNDANSTDYETYQRLKKQYEGK